MTVSRIAIALAIGLALYVLLASAGADAQTSRRTYIPIAAMLDAGWVRPTPIYGYPAPVAYPAPVGPTSTPVPLATTAPSVTPSSTAQVAASVGRADVRTLSDADARRIAFGPRRVSVTDLLARRRPDVLAGREGIELIVLELAVTMWRVTLGEDGVLHLMVGDASDPERTFILEFPDPDQPSMRRSLKRAETAAARGALVNACGLLDLKGAVDLTGNAVIAGPAFFAPDPVAGAAPSGLGLAPVLSFATEGCNGRGVRVGSPTATATSRPGVTSVPTATSTRTATRVPTTTTAPAPSAGFGAGIKRVGVDISAGTYRSVDIGQAGGWCYWERLKGFSGELIDIISNDIETEGRAIVAISSTDAGFNSQAGCAPWTPLAGPITQSRTAPFGPGTFAVGLDIAPGTWSAPGTGRSCYWERLRGFTGRLDQIIANHLDDGAAVVTIAESDVGFASTRCGTWTKIG